MASKPMSLPVMSHRKPLVKRRFGDVMLNMKHLQMEE